MGKNFVEPPLEGLWWADDLQDFICGKRDRLNWLHGEFLPAHNLIPNGHHHEIYLNDPSRVECRFGWVARCQRRTSGALFGTVLPDFLLEMN